MSKKPTEQRNNQNSSLKLMPVGTAFIKSKNPSNRKSIINKPPSVQYLEPSYDMFTDKYDN